MFKRYNPLEICIDGINLVANGSPFWTQDKNCNPDELAKTAKGVVNFQLGGLEHNSHDALECSVDSINYACVKTSCDVIAYPLLFNEVIESFPPHESELYNGDIIRMLMNEVLHVERLNAAYLDTFCAFFEENPERLIRLSKPYATIGQLFDAWKHCSDQWKRMILHWIAAFRGKPQRHKGVHPFWHYACGLSKKKIERSFESELVMSPMLYFHYQYTNGFFNDQAKMFLAKDPEAASAALASFEKEDRAAEARYRKWEKLDAYERFGFHGLLLPGAAA